MARNGKYSIDLNWLNTLGGVEHWNFTAQKTFGYGISNVVTIERDIFQNWDTDFVAGEKQSEHLNIKANESIIVRSQALTLQQVNAIAKIKYSIRVNDETDINSIVTVLVDKSSFTYRTEGDKQYFLEFNITYPDVQIQSQ